MSVTNIEPPFDPLQPSIPISYPLKTLVELESRAYFNSFHYPFNRSSVPLKSSGLENRPRLLVCHDMQGGYTDDKWVQGGNNENAYAIWHWYLIDIFVYFSHNLVTLPPPCWTNTAHKHGVKVLGTFITEGDEGIQNCNKILATVESARMYAERLAELAKELGFDGWLLNIEVSLDEKQIPNLKEFVSHLTKTMHSSVPGSLIIWYDSVTITGILNYQNQLNQLNKPFFDICDGLFANYWWQEDYPKQSATVAGDRKFDVYMGTDVFGRGTYGGGQWNSNVALDVCKKANVSAVLYAPGWVYETHQPPNFQTAQNKWWSLVEKSWGVGKFYPNTLPFYSNFDQGHGYHISVDGSQGSNASWNNLSSQGFQPFLEFKENPNSDPIQVHIDFTEESYSGGSNMTFKGNLQVHTEFKTRIFHGNLLLGQQPLQISYPVKLDGDSQLGLFLQFSKPNSPEKTSVLISAGKTNILTEKFSRILEPRIVHHNEEMAPGWVIQESSITMNGFILTEIYTLCYKSSPAHKNLISEQNIDSSVRVPSPFFAILGSITIKNSKANPIFPPSSSWLVEAQNIKWGSVSAGFKTLSVKITWKLKNGSDFEFCKYNIYVQKIANSMEGIQEYNGVAYVETFYVSELSIPSSTSSLKFFIQVCDVDGSCQKLDDSPFLQLNVQAAEAHSHQVTVPIHNHEEMVPLTTCRFNANPWRRLIYREDYKATKTWIKASDKYVIIDLLRRVATMDGSKKARGLIISLVILGTILWILNHKNMKGIMYM